MNRGNSKDVVKLFVDFKKNVLERKPSIKKMFEEISMMKFKIRPLQGDISLLNLKDRYFIEILWNLGKLDEFFEKEYDKISSSEKQTFFNLFDNLQQVYQDQLNQLNLKSKEEVNMASTIEMEIYKEDSPSTKVN